jgi:hypothetical protein
MKRLLLNRAQDCCTLCTENDVDLVIDRQRKKSYRVNKKLGCYSSESLYAPFVRRMLFEKHEFVDRFDADDCGSSSSGDDGLIKCAKTVWDLDDDGVALVDDDVSKVQSGADIEQEFEQVYEPSFGPLAALLGGQIEVTPSETWVNDRLLPELAAEEARIRGCRASFEGLPQHRPDMLASDRQVLSMVQAHCKARRYIDALLVIEEFYLQNATLSPMLHASKRDVLEATRNETFLIAWRSKVGKQVDMLIRCGMTARAAAAATGDVVHDGDERVDGGGDDEASSDAGDPLENLYHLKAVDTLPLERDHVLECLKGVWAAAADHHSEAELYLVEALRQNPELAVAFKALGDCYLAIHEPAMAWHCWQRAQKLIGATHPLFANVDHIERTVRRRFGSLLN